MCFLAYCVALPLVINIFASCTSNPGSLPRPSTYAVCVCGIVHTTGAYIPSDSKVGHLCPVLVIDAKQQ